MNYDDCNASGIPIEHLYRNEIGVNIDTQITEEILYIIDYALDKLQEESGDDRFTLPNGSTWSYEDVMEYVEGQLSK